MGAREAALGPRAPDLVERLRVFAARAAAGLPLFGGHHVVPAEGER